MRMADRDESNRADKTGFTTRMAEIATALVILPLGGLVVVDSVRVGYGWAPDGPQAGFYPFYIGLILCAAALGILVQAVLARDQGSDRFVEVHQFRLVLAILLPSTIYVAAIYLIGIYVASALFLIIFMRWQGKYPLYKAVPIGVLVPVAMFVLFEIWFKVALPKGPLETLLGY
jgi:putative tricarboxylic transport membrane protein